MRRRMKAGRLAGAAVVSLVILAQGCNWLTPLVFLGEHKKKITAEFDKLPGHRAAVLVWTDQSTLFDYGYARIDLASYLVSKLSAELATRKQTADFVDPRDVENYLGRNLGRDIEPADVAEQFNADFVIYVEVLEFQLRDPMQPQLLQGRVQASVAVYDMRVSRDRPQRYELAPVQIVQPEAAPVLMTRDNSLLIRNETYLKFAEEVARKFYDYEVEL